MIRNGDGSSSVSPGYVTVKIEMGRFRAQVTLIVAELSVFDFIMGFDLIKRFKVRLDFDPLRLSGIGEGSSKYAGRRVPIPTCMLSRRTSDGRDVSTYTEEAPTQSDLNSLLREDPMWQDAVAIMPGETAADKAGISRLSPQTPACINGLLCRCSLPFALSPRCARITGAL